MKRNILTSTLFLLLCTLISCGGDTANDTAETAAPSDTTAAVTEDPGPALSVPQNDYTGEVITMLADIDYNGFFRLDVDADGEAINDAAARRNDLVEEHLGVTFEFIGAADEPAVANTLKASVMAGDTTFDLIFPHATVGVAAMVTDGLLYDWNKLPGVDFTKPWWNTTMTDSLGIGGKLYYASGDIVMSWQGMMAILFNKTYLNSMDLEKDLYETTFDGEWTMDYMSTVIKGITQDLNGDGKMTEVDRYGLLDNINCGYVYMYSGDQRVTNTDADGYPTLVMNTERMVEIVNKYYNLVNSGDIYLDSYNSGSYATSTYRNMLLEGRSFLTTLDIGGLYSNLREIEFEFGILPMPKFDEAQEHYRVFCGAGLIGIPSNIENPTLISDVAETMAYYSYKEIRPAFFDIVLENKAVRDENSYKVIQMMHENKVFDFGFNFDTTASAYGLLKEVVITKKSTDFASVYAKKEKGIRKMFEKIVDAVKDME